VKSWKNTRQVPVAAVQVALLVDPSGAVTTTVTDEDEGTHARQLYRHEASFDPKASSRVGYYTEAFSG
jgi:hypothetical protein